MFVMAVRYVEQIWLIILKNCDNVVIETFARDGAMFV